MSTVTSPSSSDLPTLNALVAQQENVLNGPLTNIGNDGTNTTFNINAMDGTPPKNTIITTGSVPTGSTTIASGQIYISGVLTAATAYRPT
jgi:hypothetical protein